MRNTWENLPVLNSPRYNHSSCTIGKTLYVLGGFKGTRYIYSQITNSIEKLGNREGPAQSTSSRWQDIYPDQSFQPRYFNVFCALNERELIILGG